MAQRLQAPSVKCVLAPVIPCTHGLRSDRSGRVGVSVGNGRPRPRPRQSVQALRWRRQKRGRRGPVNTGARVATIIGVGVIAATGAWWLWQRSYSRDAQIDAVHQACTIEFAEAAARMKSGVQPGENPSAIAKSLTDGLGRLIEGVTGNVSETVCAAVRDACREDFDGRLCTAARERYR